MITAENARTLPQPAVIDTSPPRMPPHVEIALQRPVWYLTEQRLAMHSTHTYKKSVHCTHPYKSSLLAKHKNTGSPFPALHAASQCYAKSHLAG